MRRDRMMPFIIIMGAMVILNILDGNFSDPGAWLLNELMVLPGIVIGITFHEFAHGFVSYKLGDPTPKLQGRLTLNPMAHMNLVGFLCLLFAGFGWGNPVQINPLHYKHRRRDEFLVSIAGVTMNLILAVLFALLFKYTVAGSVNILTSQAGEIYAGMVQQAIFINLVLMVFNLIPVPPLDGWGILTQAFDLEKYSWYWTVYNNGIWILLALIFFNITGFILNPAIDFFVNLLNELIM